MRLQVVEARGPEDFDRAFSDMTRARAGALAVWATPVFDAQRQRLVDLAAKNRLPAVYSFRRYVESGGLMSYGPDLPDVSQARALGEGILNLGQAPSPEELAQPVSTNQFWLSMRQLGWVDGQNMVVERRFGESAESFAQAPPT